MVDGKGGDLQVADPCFPAGHELTMSFSQDLDLSGEDPSGTHHLAGARGGMYGNLRSCLPEEAGMVHVGVGEQDGIRCWSFGKQPRHVR